MFLTDCAEIAFLTGRDNSWAYSFCIPGHTALHLNDRYDSAFAGLFPFFCAHSCVHQLKTDVTCRLFDVHEFLVELIHLCVIVHLKKC